MYAKQRGLLGISTAPLVIAAVLFASISGYLLVTKRNVNRLEGELATAIAQRNQAEAATQKAVAVARQNEQTIAQLQAEKKAADDAITELEKARATAGASRETRNVIIQRQATTPSSRTVIPPVLADLVTSIQSDRLKRRAP